MRISYVSNAPIGKSSAYSTHVMKMCEALSLRGNTVTLYGSGNPRSNWKSYAPYYGVANNFSIVLHRLRKIPVFGLLSYGFIQGLRVVFARSNLCYSRCIVTIILPVLARKKVYLELHETPRNRFTYFILRFLLEDGRISRLIVISQRLKEILSRDFGLTHCDTIVAHDASNVEKTDADSTSVPGSVRLTIGYTGGLRAGNGIEMLIDLAERLPQHLFVLYGGSHNDATQWRMRAKSSNIVIHPSVPPSEVFAVQKSCDVLMAPYQKGAMTGSGRDTSDYMSPMKIFEYMSAGRAIVCSDFPVIREVLDQKTAILVQSGDIDSWVKAVRHLENSRVRRELGKAAQRLLFNKYTWSARADLVLVN